jgi:hypothetical protein
VSRLSDELEFFSAHLFLLKVDDLSRAARNDVYPLLASWSPAHPFCSWMSLPVVSILCCDFQTSSVEHQFLTGLDAYNAFNVVECLVSLARDYKRTVVFTIHQPRSNIVSMFDHLIVLSMGKMVYSGEFSKCQGYFTSIGEPCPPGFNIADFLSEYFTCDFRLHAIDTIAIMQSTSLRLLQCHNPHRTAPA